MASGGETGLIDSTKRFGNWREITAISGFHQTGHSYLDRFPATSQVWREREASQDYSSHTDSHAGNSDWHMVSSMASWDNRQSGDKAHRNILQLMREGRQRQGGSGWQTGAVHQQGRSEDIQSDRWAADSASCLTSRAPTSTSLDLRGFRCHEEQLVYRMLICICLILCYHGEYEF